MGDIKDKIAKLLALADSPNEHEAKRALLKARELMANNNLRPEEIAHRGDEAVVKKTIDVYCTQMTDSWAVPLSVIVADHYCCRAFTRRGYRAKKSQIGFVGLADDFDVCIQIYLYAYHCVKADCARIKEKCVGLDASVIREACNAYGAGFCVGLLEAFEQQEAEHREWGLVMATPQPVMDMVAKIKPLETYGRTDNSGVYHRFTSAGRKAGKAFDPNHRLTENGK